MASIRSTTKRGMNNFTHAPKMSSQPGLSSISERSRRHIFEVFSLLAMDMMDPQVSRAKTISENPHGQRIALATLIKFCKCRAFHQSIYVSFLWIIPLPYRCSTFGLSSGSISEKLAFSYSKSTVLGQCPFPVNEINRNNLNLR